MELDSWLDAKVRIKLFGEWREARICEIHNDSIYPSLLVCELWDGEKHVKVGASYQAYRKEHNDGMDSKMA